MNKTNLSVSVSLSALVLMFFSMAFSSCTKDPDSFVLLRVNNQSAVQLENMVLYAPEGELHFGMITGGDASEYRTFGSSYTVPVCSFIVEGQEYRFMVRCATPAPEKINMGRYAVLIRSFSGENADIELVRE